MKITMLQQNFTVGDFEGNTAKILRGYKEACRNGAELVVSSELAIWGYPPKDMLERPGYVAKQDEYFENLCAEIGEVGLIIGITERNKSVGKPLFNSAVLIENGKVIATRCKTMLPTYDVFDESRYFQPGKEIARVVKYRGKRLGILVCEEIWKNGTENPYGEPLYQCDPIEELKDDKPDILAVINGSPYYWGKGSVRFDLVGNIASRLNCPVIYVNQVGGNDDLIFDGRSFALDSSGRCMGAGNPSEEKIVMVDTESKIEILYQFDQDQIKYLYDALVLGTRDYVKKTGHDTGVVALSGGIDSAVTAHIAVDALGRKNVIGVGMPSPPYSPEDSLEDAWELAQMLDIKFHIIPIRDIYNSFGRALEPVIGWYEPGSCEGDVTEENIQPRTRGVLVMAMTNRKGPKKPLLISTGNKSEIAMGFCTLYGDTAGGLAPISDVWKTDVYDLANYINRFRNRIPKNTITKPPSAGLRVNQKDEDSLPPYRILDPILHAYIEEQKEFEEIVAMGHDGAVVRRVINQVNRNEFKRRQMPPGLKITSKAFGTGRRWPIAAKFL